MAEYKVLKDIAFEKNRDVIKYKIGNKLSDGDFPNKNFVKGFLSDKSISMIDKKAKAEKVKVNNEKV